MAGFTNQVLGCKNVDFREVHPVEGQVTQDGELLIGAASSPYIRINRLTSADGSIEITNGPGTIDLAGSAQGFRPNAVLQDFDDFLSTSLDLSKLSWEEVNWSYHVDGTAGHPGIQQARDDLSAPNYQYLSCSGVSGATPASTLVLGSGEVWVNWNMRLAALSDGTDTYTIQLGLADYASMDAASTAIVDGVYFSYTHSANSGNWVINSTNTSTTTSGNTSNAADTEFHTFSINVNAAGSSVSFYIDNVQVANSPLATNIPTAAVAPFVKAYLSAGTSSGHEVDLFWITQVLSNPRPGPLIPALTAQTGYQVNNYRQVTDSAQVLGTDYIIGVGSTASTYTMTLPAAINPGQTWIIKDESGGASGNNITVSGNGNNIDGAATYPITTDYGAVTIYASGSQYHIA